MFTLMVDAQTFGTNAPALIHYQKGIPTFSDTKAAIRKWREENLEGNLVGQTVIRHRSDNFVAIWLSSSGIVYRITVVLDD